MVHQPNTQPKTKYSKAADFVAAGYAIAALGLMGLLTVNGQSTVPQWAQLTAYVLIATGLLLPAGGILVLRNAFDRTQTKIRNGLLMQGLGLVILFFGIAYAVVLSALQSFLIGAVSLFAAGALSLIGAIMPWVKHKTLEPSGNRKTIYLVLGTILILSGVGLIVASNLAFYYFLPQVENTVYTDIGTSISACGCVTTAYSYVSLRAF